MVAVALDESTYIQGADARTVMQVGEASVHFSTSASALARAISNHETSRRVRRCARRASTGGRSPHLSNTLYWTHLGPPFRLSVGETHDTRTMVRTYSVCHFRLPLIAYVARHLQHLSPQFCCFETSTLICGAYRSAAHVHFARSSRVRSSLRTHHVQHCTDSVACQGPESRACRCAHLYTDLLFAHLDRRITYLGITYTSLNNVSVRATCNITLLNVISCASETLHHNNSQRLKVSELLGSTCH